MPAAHTIFPIVARHNLPPSECRYWVNHRHDRSKKGFIPVASCGWAIETNGWLVCVVAGISSEPLRSPRTKASTEGDDDVHQRETCTLRCRRARQYFGCSHGSSTSDDPPGGAAST